MDSKQFFELTRRNPAGSVPLTSLMQDVLDRMRAQGADFLANRTEEHWRLGKPYYIDDRVKLKNVRRDFKRCNEQIRRRGGR